MANPLDNRYMTQSPSAAAAADIDVGLRQYMLKVYNYMSVGLVVTGLIALLVSEHAEIFNAVTYSPLRWVVILAPLGFALLFGFRIQQMRAVTAEILYWAFAAVMGLSISYIFVLYSHASIARVFFITAGTFAGHEPLRLHDEAGPDQHRQLPGDGAVRSDPGDAGESVHAVGRSLLRHLGRSAW